MSRSRQRTSHGPAGYTHSKAEPNTNFYPTLTRICPAKSGAKTCVHFNTPQGMEMDAQKLIPLDREARSALPTPEAARHLNRSQQTLRLWAMRENGPIRPMRINGRLAWSVAELRRILNVQTVA